MVKIYHNSRCGKSREALKTLEEKGIEPVVVEYMKEPMTEKGLAELLLKLDMDAIDLVRTKETDWKENFKGKELDEGEIILAMIEYPKLMERPIIEKGNKAVVARPADKMNELL